MKLSRRRLRNGSKSRQQTFSVSYGRRQADGKSDVDLLVTYSTTNYDYFAILVLRNYLRRKQFEGRYCLYEIPKQIHSGERAQRSNTCKKIPNNFESFFVWCFSFCLLHMCGEVSRYNPYPKKNGTEEEPFSEPTYSGI